MNLQTMSRCFKKKLLKIVSKGFAMIVLFLVLTSFHSAESAVYICGPNGAKRYHLNQSCRGLSACKHEVVKVTLATARNKGLTLCGWED